MSRQGFAGTSKKRLKNKDCRHILKHPTHQQPGQPKQHTGQLQDIYPYLQHLIKHAAWLNAVNGSLPYRFTFPDYFPITFFIHVSSFMLRRDIKNKIKRKARWRTARSALR